MSESTSQTPHSSIVKRTILFLVLLAVITLGTRTALQFFEPPPADSPHLDSERRITLVDSVILGVVEGLTEYLPVSSTGHLILASHALKLSAFSHESTITGPKLEQVKALHSFEIIIQIGAILAVIGLYKTRVINMAQGIFGKNPKGLRLTLLLLTGFAPAAIIGLIANDFIKAYLFSPITVAWALAVGGVVMLLFDPRRLADHGKDHKRVATLESMQFRQALLIGLFQCIAFCPGASRSMVTILGGTVTGLTLVQAAEFSFLLALPTLGAATGYELVTNTSVFSNTNSIIPLLVGTLVSMLFAALTMHTLIKWLTRHGLAAFGWYRIVIAIAVILLLVL